MKSITKDEFAQMIKDSNPNTFTGDDWANIILAMLERIDEIDLRRPCPLCKSWPPRHKLSCPLAIPGGNPSASMDAPKYIIGVDLGEQESP